MSEKLKSDREFTQPKKDVLTKGLNVAVAPEQIPVVDPISATSVIRKQQVGRHGGRKTTAEGYQLVPDSDSDQ